jgi:hypothetical protein
MRGVWVVLGFGYFFGGEGGALQRRGKKPSSPAYSVSKKRRWQTVPSKRNRFEIFFFYNSE